MTEDTTIDEVTTIIVTWEQVASAEAAIEIAGGVDTVDPLVAMIAAPQPREVEDADRPVGPT